MLRLIKMAFDKSITYFIHSSMCIRCIVYQRVGLYREDDYYDFSFSCCREAFCSLSCFYSLSSLWC